MTYRRPRDLKLAVHAHGGAVAPRAIKPIIDTTDQSPPFLAYTLSLYRTHGGFRALVDLTWISLITLIFSQFAGPPKNPWSQQQTQASQPAPQAMSYGAAAPSPQQTAAPRSGLVTDWIPYRSRAPKAQFLSPLAAEPGTMTASTIERVIIPNDVIANVPHAIKPQYQIAVRHLQSQDGILALAALDALDPAEPTVTYARAVALLFRGGADAHLDALREIRRATERGLPHAFTLTGILLMRPVLTDKQAGPTARAFKTIDGAGNVIAVTRGALAAEAVQWFQRGAALGHVGASLYLGFVEAKGMQSGLPNEGNAVAHWREAARHGNPYAHFELGRMHMKGGGSYVAPTFAADHFREAAAGGLLDARLGLASQLFWLSGAQEYAVADEARANLITFIRQTENRDGAAAAYFLLGSFHDMAAPSRERKPQQAIAYWHAGALLGDDRSRLMLMRSYRTGLGVESDRAKAIAMSRHLPSGPETAREIKDLEQQLTETERAKADRLRDVFALPDFATEQLSAAGFLDCHSGKLRLYGTAGSAVGPSAEAKAAKPGCSH